MPLEPEFKTFANEADFTSRFLVPLLRRLGYSVVAEYHGQREFGKDLVFGEIDRFGEIVYHGLQSKFQERIGQSDSEGLIEDCKQAFRHSFRHPTTGAEHRIASFVVANAGSIGDNARANFFTAATNAEHGGAVKMLDGKALLALDRWATINRVEDVGETLSGLLIELGVNKNILFTAHENLRALLVRQLDTVPFQKLRTAAFSHYMQKPLLPSQIDTGLANQYLTLVDLVNGALDGLRFDNVAARVMQSDNMVRETGNSILDLCDKVVGLAGQLEASIKFALTSLGPLVAL